MHLHSLGYRTDLIFPRFDGLILDRGDYLVIQTPANPLFYWGHFLFFAAPPEAGDLDRWQQLFTNEFRALPHVKHFAFGWDAPDGAVGEIQHFLDAGFHCFKDIVLVAEAVYQRCLQSSKSAVATALQLYYSAVDTIFKRYAKPKGVHRCMYGFLASMKSP